MGSCFAHMNHTKLTTITTNKISTNLQEENKQVPVKKLKLKAKAIDNRLKSLDITDASSAIIEDREKSPKDIEIIDQCLKKHFIFNDLTEEQKNQVISHMKLYTLNPGSIIFEQDSPGNTFFIIATGKVEVIVNNKRKNILKAGDSFGELALLHGTLRSASIKTIERTTL